MFHVYVLYSEDYDRFYIDQTGSIETCINRHNNGKVKSTKSYVPWELDELEDLIQEEGLLQLRHSTPPVKK